MSDESIRDRLKRLRRDAPAPREAPEVPEVPQVPQVPSPDASSSAPSPTTPQPAPTPEPTSAPTRGQVFARLARRASADTHAGTPVKSSEETSDARSPAGDASTRALPTLRMPASPRESLVLPVRELSLDPPRDLVRDARGTWARTQTFARAHRHGSVTLDEVLRAPLSRLAECARDERLAGVDLERAVFFDTETTGLSGGAGTYVFLVGLGRFVGERFELWQGFLPHPSDETTLLTEVAERIAAASVLVSFFGKSFDRHRLEDKMRLHGVAPPFEQTIHLDLYHPLRRAHRGKFENCRLKTLERELVGVQRDDDLPGSFAPAAWFDFLAQRPHRLEGVFRHNADDVLSLTTLCAYVAR